MSRLHPTFQEPDIRIDDAALHSWEHDQLANAEVLLTTAIHESRNQTHPALASRALVRARLRQWDAAIADATEVTVPPPSHALTLMCNQVHQNPAIRHWIHCKECSPCRKRGKAQGISGVRHCIRALPHNARYLSPFDQGLCPMHSSLVALRSLYCLGHHRVYGRRARRRDIPCRRPHRCGAVQLDLLCGSGMCIRRCPTKNITTDIPSRHTCIFSSETLAWGVVTTRVRYDLSSVHEPKPDPTRVEHSRWSH